jgi:quercetin dioxygenase-like cupin family protein
VFAYVLDGAVTSQLEGEAPVTYKAGDSWYEPPEAGHIVSRNASQTKPATLLVWLVAPEGRPVVNPIPQGKK